MRLHNKKKRTYPAIKQEQRLTVEKFGGPTLVLFPHLTRCYNFQGRGVPGKGECECLTLVYQARPSLTLQKSELTFLEGERGSSLID